MKKKKYVLLIYSPYIIIKKAEMKKIEKKGILRKQLREAHLQGKKWDRLLILNTEKNFMAPAVCG